MRKYEEQEKKKIQTERVVQSKDKRKKRRRGRMGKDKKAKERSSLLAAAENGWAGIGEGNLVILLVTLPLDRI